MSVMWAGTPSAAFPTFVTRKRSRSGGSRTLMAIADSRWETTSPTIAPVWSLAIHSAQVEHEENRGAEAVHPPDDPTDPRWRQSNEPAPAGQLGRGAGADGRRSASRRGGPRPADLRHLQLQQGDQRGQLRGSEI